jgi:hypothetical protein
VFSVGCADDCMDAGGRATQEQLPRNEAHHARENGALRSSAHPTALLRHQKGLCVSENRPLLSINLLQTSSLVLFSFSHLVCCICFSVSSSLVPGRVSFLSARCLCEDDMV